MSNDAKNPMFELKITGFVEKFVTILPKRVNLRGMSGQPVSEVIHIIPEKKYPFKILSGKARKGEDIDFTFKEVVEKDVPQYVLTVENLKKDGGRYFDSIILKTDNKDNPEISINVYGDIKSVEKEKTGTNPAEEKKTETTPKEG